MKCIHHIDADGLCAAAIVRHELLEVFMPPTEEDFIPYNHGWELKLPDPDKLRINEPVYIVDLALDDTIMNAIRYFVEHGCHVVHIDHHIGGKRYYETMSYEDKTIYDGIVHFFNDKISGTMLTWVYACMHNDERMDPGKVSYDFTEKYDHVAFWIDTSNFREYGIPLAIRYIDDNDVWRHALPESKYFAVAFTMEESTKPMDDKFWTDLLYSTTGRMTVNMVNNGELAYKYQEHINQSTLKNAFEHVFDGIKTLCLNAPYGNSRIFCEKYDEYPMVCKFVYDGHIGKWRYTFYSNGKDENVDCAKIATKYFNGGGHKCAAGGQSDFCFFDMPDNYVGNAL